MSTSVKKTSEKYDYLFKIVLIGDSGVGKTNLLSKLTKDVFSTDSKATIGVEFATMSFDLKDAVIKAQIWDTAGQERYRAITSAYYRGTLGALIVYDVTKKITFKSAINQWLDQLRQHSQENISIMLIGNKTDLENQREVTKAQGNDIAVQNNLSFIETSAYSGENVAEAFKQLVVKVYEINKAKEQANMRKGMVKNQYKGVPLRKPKKKNSGCC
ncbi:RAS-related GTP-binding protein Rab11 [Hamiltosporidium tvaerminnensis]|uniref:RAS-related GTP-binding protein Rab11 n=2 Tax=Hamiltosporidium TaxID=1176354 RepID=A0A4Q9LI24_9MICR|nr:RAS-related GTP-binding protein Rab11 [Hamiltosporidium magnivora]TBU09541.1 RAS-related GTP-binding protein Rab11 [Hamiltosporidium magnivora]TBU20453.1 RAS-related GTP-binding protein Rab11 [Hamiltosporidium tvaerminnensis]